MSRIIKIDPGKLSVRGATEFLKAVACIDLSDNGLLAEEEKDDQDEGEDKERSVSDVSYNIKQNIYFCFSFFSLNKARRDIVCLVRFVS